MSFKVTDCFTIVGTRGTGKSHLAREINDVYPRSVVFDPTNDWTDGVVVSSFESFAEKLKYLYSINEKTFRLIFRFNPDMDRETRENTFNQALRLCFFFKNLQVVIDELQLFTSPHYMPEYLKNLLFIGRHQGISVMGITQRPAQINKSMLSQSAHVFCGQLHERNDLRAISDFINEDVKTLIALPKRYFIWFNPETGKKLISTEKNSVKNKNIQNTKNKLPDSSKRK